MRTKIVCCSCVIVALALATASAFASSSAWRRHTFPAGPASRIVSPGRMTVEVPSGWRVSPNVWIYRWTGNRLTERIPTAEDRVHVGVRWSADVKLRTKGTTLAQIRAGESFAGWRTRWGVKSRQVGDTYLTLPLGKVWRQTLLFVPGMYSDSLARSYARFYWLDRGVAYSATTGDEYQLFELFTVTCSADQCRTDNGQLAAIMRSIRITS